MYTRGVCGSFLLVDLSAAEVTGHGREKCAELSGGGFGCILDAFAAAKDVVFRLRACGGVAAEGNQPAAGGMR